MYNLYVYYLNNASLQMNGFMYLFACIVNINVRKCDNVVFSSYTK